jgi:hypothetical protein
MALAPEAAMRLQTPAFLLIGVALLVRGRFPASAQGTFQNLGFESATIVPVSGPPIVDFGQAFPGWTGYVGGVQDFVAAYNALAMSTAGFSIIDSGFSGPSGGGLIEGNFTAFLMSGAAGVGGQADATLKQTGLVPVGTQSLRFKAYFTAPLNYLEVTLGAQTLSLVPERAGANYTLYAADIHTWAGQTAELSFTALYPHPQTGQVPVYLDSIQFSSQPIPEPSVFGLFVIGALSVHWRLRLRQGQ